jgi:hypothetical protein
LRVYSDGASRGNPGPSSIAFLILSKNGMKLGEHSRFLGVKTNNQAEYEALFNPYDDDGKLKTGDDLLKTLVRIKYRENTRGFYEYVPDESRVQEDLAEFIKSLEIEGITEEQTPERFKEEMAFFIKKNFRVSYTDAYFKRRKEIFDDLCKVLPELAELQAKISELTKLKKLIMGSKLVFDVGVNNGDDTVYYLARGYRVVAIDANLNCMHANDSRLG